MAKRAFIYIRNRWDWWVYWRAHKSIERMFQSNPAYAYLFELFIREWRAKNPIPENIERATELFFWEVKKKA